ncbi:MAG: ATP-binding protein [Pseudomonadota bacterium]
MKTRDAGLAAQLCGNRRRLPPLGLGLGLRGYVLVALLLVTVGGVASISTIGVWQTRRALAAEQFERAVVLADSLRVLAERVIDHSLPLSDQANKAQLSTTASELAHAWGVEGLAFYDRHGAMIEPRLSPGLPTDPRGVAAALAGMPPHAEELPSSAGYSFGSRLVVYAPLALGERAAGALRVVVALDRAVEAVLERTRFTLLVLGVLDCLVLVFAAGWLLRTAVVRPVADLQRAAARVAAGDLQARTAIRGPGELGSLADAFDRMTESLRQGRESLLRSEKLATVGRLAAGVAHEVGNPLAAILGYVEMLLGETTEKPIDRELRREVLARVSTETQRIHRILSELLEYSRPPREQAEKVDLRKVVEGAASLARAMPRVKGARIVIELPADLPPVLATANRLTQVFLNLLINAADATQGRGTVVIDGKPVGERVVVGVNDDGPGIPPELRLRVFDPFFTTKEPGQGTGLGLSVSQSIVEGYGGTLRVAEEAGDRGTRLEIELPAAR